MRFYLISDNSDAMNGLRLAGIEGTVARSEADLRKALDAVAKQPDIGMILVTEKIADAYTEALDPVRADQISRSQSCFPPLPLLRKTIATIVTTSAIPAMITIGRYAESN